VQVLLGGINWSFPTWDLFIFMFFVASIVFYGVALGRNRILVILISLYISLAITSNLPYLNEQISKQFSFGPVFVLKLFVFGCSMIVLYSLFTRLNLLSSIREKANIIHVSILSILHIGLIISIILSFLPPETLNLFSSLTRIIFISDIARLLWILAPIVAMFLIQTKNLDDDDYY